MHEKRVTNSMEYWCLLIALDYMLYSTFVFSIPML